MAQIAIRFVDLQLNSLTVDRKAQKTIMFTVFSYDADLAWRKP